MWYIVNLYQSAWLVCISWYIHTLSLNVVNTFCSNINHNSICSSNSMKLDTRDLFNLGDVQRSTVFIMRVTEPDYARKITVISASRKLTTVSYRYGNWISAWQYSVQRYSQIWLNRRYTFPGETFIWIWFYWCKNTDTYKYWQTCIVVLL